MTQLLAAHPGVILISNDSGGKYATNLAEAESVPNSVISAVTIILRFLSCFIRNATSSKLIFNSTDRLFNLIGAADDNVADLAMEVLAHLVVPPLAHHQQIPEVNQYSNPLVSCKPSSHEKIMCLARGWGSRGSGLGLYACVTADDSNLGQGSLPAHAGKLTFDYYDASNTVQTIHVDDKEILATITAKPSHSTSTLFFECIKKAAGRDNIPNDKLFPLLTQLRLAKDFHRNATRTTAVKRRLKAIICALYSHPSQEVLTGYFQAQPELCVEMIDLLKPTISSSSVSSTPLSSTGNVYNSNSAISVIAESSEVPYSIKKIAVDALTALVSRREGNSGPSRHHNVFQELGVGKGQYLGFLPTLIRYSLASLNSFITMETSKVEEPTQSESEDMLDFSDSLGFAFANAVKSPSRPIDEQIELGLEFIDSVLTLTSAVVSAPHGTASLTDCGLIPALVSTIILHSRLSPIRIGSNPSRKELYSECLMNHISAQAIQIIDAAIATNSTALNVFLELKGIDVLVNRNWAISFILRMNSCNSILLSPKIVFSSS